MKHYIGVDLGKQSSYFVVEDQAGNILHRAKVTNDRSSIEATLKPFLIEPCRAVMEATCNYYWMYEQLNSMGVEVILARRAIYPLKEFDSFVNWLASTSGLLIFVPGLRIKGILSSSS